MNYRLCLRGTTGRIAKVRRYLASTDECAIAKARELLADDPTLFGFELWDWQRNVVEFDDEPRAVQLASRAASDAVGRGGRWRKARMAKLLGLIS